MTAGAPAAPAAPEQPAAAPAGGIICVPVKVPQPDPNDSTKTIEVEQIACYNAPAPEATPAPASAVSETPTTAAPTTATPVTSVEPTAEGVALAPLQTTPFTIPEGMVPLAPFNPSANPDLLKLPGDYYVNSRSQALMAESSGINVARGNNHNYGNMVLTTIVSILIAYCLR